MTSKLLNLLRKSYPPLEKVIDARLSLVLKVTDADIRMAKRKDLNNCAVAVSCSRSKKPDFVIATRSRLYVINKKIATRYMMPHNVVREITSFDRGATFSPGTYRMPAIPSTSALGFKKERTPRGSRNKSKGPIHRSVIQNIRIALTDRS